MGLWTKLIAGLLGVLLIGGPLWPLAIACFLYLAISPRPKRSSGRASHSPSRSSKLGRYFVGLGLVIVAALALAAGGRLSPVAFLLAGLIVLLWPALAGLLPAAEAIPIRNSILLRSKYLPLRWHALAEFKAGSEYFPRALSSFAGSLLVFTGTGKSYALATCIALGRRTAEAKLHLRLRSSNPGSSAGAYLLPLDSGSSAEVLRRRLVREKLPAADLVESAPRVSGALLLECQKASVMRASAFRIDGESLTARIPGSGKEFDGTPLTWEVLEGVGKRAKWPDPDEFSSLLDSLAATRGIPLGDRLKTMEGHGDEVSVKALAGGEVRVTRPQLRAIVSIYS
jgi:hypothetical protein